VDALETLNPQFPELVKGSQKELVNARAALEKDK
jgi:hypothetical protein